MRLATLCDEQQHLNDERKKWWKEKAGGARAGNSSCMTTTLMQKHEKKRDFAFNAIQQTAMEFIRVPVCFACSFALLASRIFFHFFVVDANAFDAKHRSAIASANAMKFIQTENYFAPHHHSPPSTVARANFLAQYVFTCDHFCTCREIVERKLSRIALLPPASSPISNISIFDAIIGANALRTQKCNYFRISNKFISITADNIVKRLSTPVRSHISRRFNWFSIGVHLNIHVKCCRFLCGIAFCQRDHWRMTHIKPNASNL